MESTWVSWKFQSCQCICSAHSVCFSTRILFFTPQQKHPQHLTCHLPIQCILLIGPHITEAIRQYRHLYTVLLWYFVNIFKEYFVWSTFSYDFALCAFSDDFALCIFSDDFACWIFVEIFSPEFLALASAADSKWPGQNWEAWKNYVILLSEKRPELEGLLKEEEKIHLFKEKKGKRKNIT